MMELEGPDKYHLEAADGWLELGNHTEADAELDKLSFELHNHPGVLTMRWHVCAAAERWEVCVDIAERIVELAPDRPEGWVHRSFACHVLKRTQEAYDLLLPAAINFPKEWMIPYNLACYAAQLGRLNECAKWFNQAVRIDAEKTRRAAMGDLDLKPLWDSMAKRLDGASGMVG
jgi:tetratricopeptide (TPR) repeat protein